MNLIRESKLKAMLDVSTSLLYSWRRQGMPFVQLSRRGVVLYDPNKVKAWLEASGGKNEKGAKGE